MLILKKSSAEAAKDWLRPDIDHTETSLPSKTKPEKANFAGKASS
jgi:hypothetical protein